MNNLPEHSLYLFFDDPLFEYDNLASYGFAKAITANQATEYKDLGTFDGCRECAVRLGCCDRDTREVFDNNCIGTRRKSTTSFFNYLFHLKTHGELPQYFARVMQRWFGEVPL